MKIKSKKILLGIILLAILVRAVNLPQRFEGDEIAHVMLGKNFLQDGSLKILDISKSDPGDDYDSIEYSFSKKDPFREWKSHPPADVLTFAFFASLTSLLPEEIAFRLLPFLGGILAIFLTYLIGKKLFNEKVGLIAASLETISTYHIFHSSFILENDAILAFLVPLSFFLYLKFREKRTPVLFVLTGISLSLIILTKINGLLFLLFILFYELTQKKVKSALGLLVVVCSLFGIWLVADYFLTNLDYSGYVIKNGIPFLDGGGGMALGERIYRIGYSGGLLVEELTPPLCLLFLLAFISLLKKFKFNDERMLAIWILMNFIYFFIGTGDPQRYFGIAVPFLFILVAKFITKFKLEPRKMVIACLFFLAICYFFQINDYQFYTYFVYGNNLLNLVIWTLPFLLVLPYLVKNFRTQVISILIGAYLGFSIYFILFSTSAWPIAISETTGVAEDEEIEMVVSKSSYVLESVMYYDWVKDGNLEKRYFQIPLDKVKQFDQENRERCRKMLYGSYPLIFLCN